MANNTTYEVNHYEDWSFVYWPWLLQMDYTNDLSVQPPFVQFVKLYIAPLFIIIGIIANALTFRLMLLPSMKKHTFSIFLLALAISDNGVLLSFFVSWLNLVHSKESSNALVVLDTPIKCVFAEILPEICQIWSAWLIVTISLQRMSMVCFPHRSKLACSPQYSKYFTIAVFVLPVFSNSLPVAIFSNFHDELKSCVLPAEFSAVVHVFTGCIMEYIPVALVILSNVAIITMLVKRKDVGQGKWKEQNLLRVTAMLLVLTFSFVILTLPAWLLENYFVANPEKRSNKGLMTLAMFFALNEQINYSINFFIYVLTNRSVRQALWELLGVKKYVKRLKKGTESSPSVSNTMELRVTQIDEKSEALAR